MLADAEVICLAHDFLAGLGIENVQLRINSVGCPGCREAHRKALRDFLRPKYDELCDTCKDRFERNPLRILDCKSEVCQKLVQGAPMMIDFLCEECKDAFDQVQQNLTSMGIGPDRILPLEWEVLPLLRSGGRNGRRRRRYPGRQCCR